MTKKTNICSLLFFLCTFKFFLHSFFLSQVPKIPAHPYSELLQKASSLLFAPGAFFFLNTISPKLKSVVPRAKAYANKTLHKNL